MSILLSVMTLNYLLDKRDVSKLLYNDRMANKICSGYDLHVVKI